MLDRVFAAIYDPLLAGAERGRLGAARAELLRDVAGHVLVVGAGTGADLRHLPDAVTQLTLVEPSGPMRDRLPDAVPPRLLPVTEVVGAFAERMPLGDASVDHAVLSLVLCSVRDPDAAVDELHRVVRPGGTVRVLEHGTAASPTGRAVQRAVNPVWRVVAAGCNLDRDAAALLGRRFDVTELEIAAVPPVSRVGRVTLGAARR